MKDVVIRFPSVALLPITLPTDTDETRAILAYLECDYVINHINVPAIGSSVYGRRFSNVRQ